MPLSVVVSKHATEPSLREGSLDHRPVAVRRCVGQIVIDRENHEEKIEVRVLPAVS